MVTHRETLVQTLSPYGDPIKLVDVDGRMGMLCVMLCHVIQLTPFRAFQWLITASILHLLLT